MIVSAIAYGKYWCIGLSESFGTPPNQLVSHGFSSFSLPMTDPWCCYIWCAMDPINIPQMLAYIQAPWILWAII